MIPSNWSAISNARLRNSMIERGLNAVLTRARDQFISGRFLYRIPSRSSSNLGVIFSYIQCENGDIARVAAGAKLT